jgi:tetratricopeptide (TPR) repeat protein
MPDNDTILALVHEGWDHLKRQRPVAAWASWRRALRLEPEQKAATHALHVLANAGDLPLAARIEYRFLTTADDARRARWDGAFRGRDLEDLAVAAGAFAGLAEADPLDARARFNQGLCLAWMGRNAEAVAALDLAIMALAIDEPGTAVDAWTLAEVLRQGAGAERLADDLNHVVTIAWTPGDDPADFLDHRPDVRAVDNPIDPLTGRPELSEARLYEWLDRPIAAEPVFEAVASFADLRRVRATVVRLPGSVRLSGTDPVLLEETFAEVAHRVADRIASASRSATPLPLAFLDAAVWAIRMPPGLDDEARGRLNRSAVERYYEAAWLVRPRQGLGGLAPVEAGRLASEGDVLARVRLEAVVRLREQLGERPTTAALYQGYPFDRLRRRLGLAPTDPDTVDPLDATSMSGPELDALDPETLDDVTLADAYESAAALGDDARTARFGAPLSAREPSSLIRLDRRALFATLVRSELASGSTEGAMARLDRAEAVDLALDSGRDRATYETWRAEVYVRVGQAAEAVAVYRRLAEGSPGPSIPLDAAETLLDAGFEAEGEALAREALDRAEASGDDAAVERVKAILLGEL